MHQDRQLVERLLVGYPEAISLFHTHNLPVLRDFLVSRCADERSRQAARDLADDIATDCFGRSVSTPLLQLYSGQGSLNGWLKTVGHSRLQNFWKSGRAKYEMQTQTGATPDLVTDDTAPTLDQTEVAHLLANALQRALDQLPSIDLVRLRLVFCHGVKRERLAELWSCHPSTIGRSLAEALDCIRKETMATIRRLDPLLEITWEDCLRVCADTSGMAFDQQHAESEQDYRADLS